MVKLYASIIFAGLSCLVVTGVATAQSTPPVANTSQRSQSAVIAMGRAIAVENCQTCHAVGRTGRSANRRAPPLRTLSQKYPIETLSEAFAEGIMVGHTEMPEFQFEPAQVEGLLAYIQSIQPRKRGKR